MQDVVSFNGSGLGLRTEFINDLLDKNSVPFTFMELAPENWLDVGGVRKERLNAINKKYPIIAHGLNLSIGSAEPIDFDFLAKLKNFFRQNNINYYSEHLSYCSNAQGYLYDLLPLPFTEEAVKYIASRIIQVQDYLGMQVAFENSSYYYQLKPDLTEIDFINALISESGCALLLDVNNVYVNAFNHDYCAKTFIKSIASEKISYLHIAGHHQESSNLIIDTHADDVKESVWELLSFTYKTYGIKPTLLERDSDIPPLNELLVEVERINKLQGKACG